VRNDRLWDWDQKLVKVYFFLPDGSSAPSCPGAWNQPVASTDRLKPEFLIRQEQVRRLGSSREDTLPPTLKQNIRCCIRMALIPGYSVEGFAVRDARGMLPYQRVLRLDISGQWKAGRSAYVQAWRQMILLTVIPVWYLACLKNGACLQQQGNRCYTGELLGKRSVATGISQPSTLAERALSTQEVSNLRLNPRITICATRFWIAISTEDSDGHCAWHAGTQANRRIRNEHKKRKKRTSEQTISLCCFYGLPRMEFHAHTIQSYLLPRLLEYYAVHKSTEEREKQSFQIPFLIQRTWPNF